MGTESIKPELIPDEPLRTLLKDLRNRRGLSLLELAELIEISPAHLNDIEFGKRKPTRNKLISILKVLSLTLPEINQILDSYEYRPTTQTEVANHPPIIDTSQIGGTIGIGIHQLIHIQQQFQDIKDSIKELKNTSQEETPSTEGLSSQLLTILDEIQQNVLRAEKTTEDALTAPVRIPRPQDMEIILLPSTALERLEEYRQDESIWFGWVGVGIGTFLGIIINVATGGEMKIEAWLIGIILIIVTIIFGYFARQAKSRGDMLRKKLLDNYNQHESD